MSCAPYSVIRSGISIAISRPRGSSGHVGAWNAPLALWAKIGSPEGLRTRTDTVTSLPSSAADSPVSPTKCIMTTRLVETGTVGVASTFELMEMAVTEPTAFVPAPSARRIHSRRIGLVSYQLPDADLPAGRVRKGIEL